MSSETRIPAEIKDRQGGEDVFVFCLESRFRDYLLSIIDDRYQWAIWVDSDGTRRQGTDDEVRVFEDGMTELVEGIKLSKLLETIEDIALNGGNEMCCCCGCKEDDGTVLPEPGNPSDPNPIPNPIPDEPPVIISGSDKCDRATEISSRFVDVFVKFDVYWQTVTVSVQAVEAFITQYLQGFALAVIRGWIMSMLTTAISAVILANLAEKAKEAAQSIQQQLMCVVYNATSAAQAKQNWFAVVAQVRDVYGVAVHFLLAGVSYAIDFTKVMSTFIQTDPIYEGSTCVCVTQGFPSDPDTGSGFRWELGTLFEVSPDIKTTNLVVDESMGKFEWTFTIDVANYTWSPTMECTAPSIGLGEKIAGFTYLVVDTYADDNVESPGGNVCRIDGEVTAGPFRRLWVRPDAYQYVDDSAVWDKVQYQNQSWFDPGILNADPYARIGVSGTPPGSGYVRVFAAIWLIEEA